MPQQCELDIVSGEVMHFVLDVQLPSSIPLLLSRRYLSSFRECDILGWGWTHNFTRVVSLTHAGVTKHNSLDGDLHFPAAECDGQKGPFIQFVKRKSRDSDAAAIFAELEQQLNTTLHQDLMFLSYPTGEQELYLAASPLNSRWLLQRYLDPDRNRLLYHYDGTKLTSIETPERITIEISYGNAGLISRLSVIDRKSPKKPLVGVEYQYGPQKDLIQYIDETGQPWRYEYIDHLLVRSTAHNKLGRNYIYDASRQCIGAWSDGGHLVRSRDFDTREHLVILTDSYGSRSLYRCNSAGVIASHVDSQGNTTVRTLDERNNVLGTVAADGNVYSYAIKSSNGLLSECDGAGGMWRTETNEKARSVRIVSPTGRVRIQVHDKQGRPTHITAPNGGVIQYRYDSRGNLSSLTDPSGYEISREVSHDRQHTRILDRYGVLFEQYFDGIGNLLAEIDASGRRTEFAYHVTDVPEREIAPGGAITRYAYDAAMNLVSQTDPLNRIRKTEYDAYGNMIGEIDPLGARTEKVYDHENNLLRLTNEKGEALKFTYDSLYRKVAIAFFDGQITRFELDPLGRRTAITDGQGHRTELSYQGRFNISRRLFHDGGVEEYQLNADSKFVGISFSPPSKSNEPPRHAEFQYDANGNLSAETHAGRSIEYEWDAANYLVAVRDSLGDETRYMRGARHRVERIINRGQEYRLQYLPTGEITEIVFPNGLRQSFVFDAPGRMIERQMISAQGRQLTWRRYTYDLCDQLTSMHDWHWGAFEYEYDACGRLRSVRRPNGAVLESYLYDACGNLVSAPLAPQIVVGAGNRVQTAGDREFQYDGNGNLIACRETSTEWQYTWDRDDQLASVMRDGIVVGKYEYDLVNRRTRKSVQEGDIQFLYETYALRAEIFADGSHNHYVSLPGLPVPIAQCCPDKNYYYSYDQIGTPVEVFDESGELLLAIHPHAFGAAREEFRPRPNSAQIPFGFMGQYHDAESGLFYNHFRYYDARLGRYISQDPLGLYAGLNFYVYPPNPNNWVDPHGLMPAFECLSHWGPCQQWYARQKIAAINKQMESRSLQKTCTACRKNAQRRDFEGKCGGGAGSAGVGRAIDHMHELQAAGYDRCCSNLRSVEEGFNNELGKQTKSMLKDLNVGEVIGKISTQGCTGRGQCSDEGKNNVAKPPPNANDDCAAEDSKPVPQRC